MTLYTTRPSHAEWIALIAILVLAASLRLGAPGIVEFKQDEANLSERALNLVHGREFPLLGIDSSVGIPNSPVSVYILAIPYLFSSDPVQATQFVGLLNVIAVLLLYGLARRYYGPIAATVAGLLYAVNPWAVIYSRKLWAQDMLPMFILLTLATGLIGFVENTLDKHLKRWAQLLHLPLLALTGQIHYGTFILIPITLYFLWVGRKRLTRAFALSVLLAVLVVVPYAVGIAQNNLLSQGSIQKILTSGGSEPHPLTFSSVALQDAALVIAGTDLEQLVGPLGAKDFLASIPALLPVLNGLTFAVLMAALWLVVRGVRRRDGRTPVDLSILLLFALPPAAFLLTWTRMNVHYLIPMIPAAFLILGAAISDLWWGLASQIQGRRLLFGAGAVVVAGIVVLQVFSFGRLLDFVDTHITADRASESPEDYQLGFGRPLGHYLPVREAILAEKPQAVLAKLDGQYIGFHEETSIWNLLLYDVPSKRFLDENTDVYPAGNALYLSHDCAGSKLTFRLTPGDLCYAVSLRSAGDLDLASYTKTNDASLTFANGARIVAYRWQPESACLEVVWTITKVGIKDDFNFSVHFMNANKQEILNADDLSWRGRYWQPGDTAIKRLCLRNGLDRKGEIAGVRLGMYLKVDSADGPIFYNQDLYDGSGGLAGQTVEILFTHLTPIG